MRIFSRRRAQQLTMVHIRKRLDISHVKENGNEFLIERMLTHLVPRYRREKLRGKCAFLPLIPVENVFVRLKTHKRASKLHLMPEFATLLLSDAFRKLG